MGDKFYVMKDTQDSSYYHFYNISKRGTWLMFTIHEDFLCEAFGASLAKRAENLEPSQKLSVYMEATVLE